MLVGANFYILPQRALSRRTIANPDAEQKKIPPHKTIAQQKLT